jgi:hypothetical protein
MKGIAETMGRYTAESLEAKRFISGLRDLYAAGRVGFTKRTGPEYTVENHVGWVDEEGYYLVVSVAREAVEELYKRGGGLGGVSNQTLYSQMDDMDVIAKAGSRTTRTLRMHDRKMKRVLHLKREALDGEEVQP